jgi:hypothetical protein
MADDDKGWWNWAQHVRHHAVGWGGMAPNPVPNTTVFDPVTPSVAL